MKNRFIIFALYVLCGWSMKTHEVMANTYSIPYRFPSIYNPSPVSGRLYLQPIGTHEDRVINGTQIDASFGSSADYNIYFTEIPGDRYSRLTVNSNIFTAKISTGCKTPFRPVEVGGMVRSHQDKRETVLFNMIKNYHEFMGFGNVPPDGRYYGAIGENRTEIIGDSGEFFLTTFQIYAKVQLSQERDVSSLEPNWSLKLSFRIPVSDYPFDTNGISLSTGVSKSILPKFMLVGAFGIIYQDVSPNNFNATNIRVEKWAHDTFLGGIWDMGGRGGWYFSSGLRISSRRIYYIENPKSAETSYCTHWGLSYRKKMQSGRQFEFFMNCNEDLPGFGHGLEPDFRVQLGIALNLKKDS